MLCASYKATKKNDSRQKSVAKDQPTCSTLIETNVHLEARGSSISRHGDIASSTILGSVPVRHAGGTSLGAEPLLESKTSQRMKWPLLHGSCFRLLGSVLTTQVKKKNAEHDIQEVLT